MKSLHVKRVIRKIHYSFLVLLLMLFTAVFLFPSMSKADVPADINEASEERVDDISVGAIESDELQDLSLTESESEPEILDNGSSDAVIAEQVEEELALEPGTGDPIIVRDASDNEQMIPNNYDSASIQQALDTVIGYLQSGYTDQVTIIVPQGEYVLESALKIYSNTTLQLSDNTILKAAFPEYPMLYGRHLDDDGNKCPGGEACTHGGYSQLQNIEITGGVWDRDPEGVYTGWDNGVIALNHGRNISISNLEARHSTNHLFNLSGNESVTVTNVAFFDNREYTGTDPEFWGIHENGSPERFNTIEAIHLDFMNDDGGESYPRDNTPVQNVTIAGCTFKNVFAGVGSHHTNTEARASNINISDCKFENLCSMGGRPVYLYSVDESSVSGCESDSSANNFVNIADSKNAVISNNTINSPASNAIYLYLGSSAVIAQNTINGAGAAGVRVTDSSSATIETNAIGSPATHGISADKGSSVIATGNMISGMLGPEACGILVNAASISASDNIITGGKFGILFDGGSTDNTLSGNTISSTTDNGIQVAGSSTATIFKNTVEAAGKAGIRVLGSSQATLDENIITDPATRGIFVDTNADVTAKNNTITCLNPNSCGILADATGITASGNEITGGKNGIMLWAGSKDNILSDNKISSTIEDGIHVAGSSTATISNNVIDKAGQAGIDVDKPKYAGIAVIGSSQASLDANIITDPVDYGIHVGGGSYVEARGNKVSNAGSHGIFINRAAEGCVIANNTVTGSTVDGINGYETKKISITGNTVTESSGYGIFVNASTAKGASVTIDGNTSTSTLNVDSKDDIRIGGNVEKFATVDVKNNTLGERGYSIAGNSAGVLYDLKSNKTTNVSNIADQKYTGKEITPPLKVSIGKRTLANNTDYTLSYKDNINNGTATVTITGKGNYTGTLTRTFKITGGPTNIKDATISNVSNKTYTGSAITQSPTVKYGNTTLKNGTDYTLSYKNNINAGTATVTVTGKGNYAGTKSATFKINPASIEKASIAAVANQKKTGKAITPTPAVTIGTKTLKKDTDYTLSYKNNVNVGTATITVTGKGNYTGTATKTFKIVDTVPVTSIKVTGTATMNPGTTQTLKATVAPSNATNKAVTWKSSNTNLATINANGKVTAKKAGKVTFTATAKDGSKKAGSFTVTIRTPSVSYRTHVQMEGWQNFVKDGAMSGTSGKAYRLEGIEIKLANASGGISYRTHVQNIGWQNYVSNGKMAGTSGRALRLEAIEIYLTGEIAKYYDVYYRVHCQNIGWMGWAKGAKGSYSGTAGYAYRLEGIQIVLVPKNAANTSSAMPPATLKGITQVTKDTFRQK